jgi:ubiquinone/menaquinone biosynthesis C-methylase UbiE
MIGTEAGVEHTAVSRAYDAVADEYDSAYSQKKSLAEDRIVIDRVQQLLRPGFIADLGCGTAFLLDHLEIEPALYVGVDISPLMVARARTKHPKHRLHVGRIEHLTGIHSDSIRSAVSLFGPFSYADPGAAVAELDRVLKPGSGRFIVMLLGRRYTTRETYILNRAGFDVPKRLYGAAEARILFRSFADVRVQGLSCLVDALPEWLPQWFFNLYVRVEHATLGRFFPDRHYFLVVSGRKPFEWEHASSA